MKAFLYIILVLIIGSLVYNVVTYDFNYSFWGDDNRPYVIGALAGICGLILWFIMWTYNSMSHHLKQQSDK